MSAEPLPIEDDAQEKHPRDGATCGATMASPVGPLVCDRELWHPGGHGQGAIAWPRR